MSYPLPLPTRDHKEVIFAPPRAVDDLAHRHGTVIDSIASGPHEDKDWGFYIYFAELIEWHDTPEKQRSIRLAYYYAPSGAKRWLWGGQYSIEDTPAIIKDLLEKTLQKTHWFAKKT